ncbi:hypothetical protein, partial [Kutzneria sp. 744]|uniref:hypothetical protein n=1 Tax=Kutzneria sp. (strain 744) TaxID=345341 RepID=UPI001E5EDA30
MPDFRPDAERPGTTWRGAVSRTGWVVLGSGAVVALSVMGALALPAADPHEPAVDGRSPIPAPTAGVLKPLVVPPGTTPTPVPRTAVMRDGLLDFPGAQESPADDSPVRTVVVPHRDAARPAGA